MPDLQAMSNHANQESRCERHDPRPEGISTEKMTLIISRYGATWADIYSIIFPGAPVPSPYNEYGPLEHSEGQSPQSQGLADFEAYNRIELPRLVEANLQTMVNAQIAPLEESLKAMVVDIVRRCQSTVAQNYNRIQATPSIEKPRVNDEFFAAPLSLNAEQTANGDSWTTLQYPQTALEGRGLVNNETTNLFEEPPWLTSSEAELFPGIDHSSSRGINSDSGYGTYGSQSPLCTCPSQDQDPNSKS
ncbi:MAG: hypothetical protein Q9225_004384 [Loekoesia sp. 1 TL-2023]